MARLVTLFTGQWADLPLTGLAKKASGWGYDGLELVGLDRRRLRAKRAEFQIIFQDPYSSLNPRMRIIDIIEEGMNALNTQTESEIGNRVHQSNLSKE